MNLLDRHLDTVLSPRVAARFERTLAAEDGKPAATRLGSLGAGLFDAALASGKRERLLGQVVARRGARRADDHQAALRALGVAASTYERDIFLGSPHASEPRIEDDDLIRAELIEHQRWGEATSAGTGMGGVVGQLAQRVPTKVPGVGAIIAGGFSAYTIGTFGQGNSTYEILAGSIASGSEILDLAVNVANAIAGIIGIASSLRWLITIATLGAAAPLAAMLSSVALGIVAVTRIQAKDDPPNGEGHLEAWTEDFFRELAQLQLQTAKPNVEILDDAKAKQPQYKQLADALKGWAVQHREGR